MALAVLALLAACGSAETVTQAETGGDIIPGTDIVVPAAYADGGKIHFTERVASFAERNPPPGGVAMVGDSLTEGGDWRVLLPGVETVNFGVGWDQTTGLRNRLSQIRAAEPSKILLLIGTNDLGNGRSASETADNAGEIIDRLAALVGAENLLVQAVTPREAALRGEVEALNARLAAHAREAGADYIDLYTPFLSGDRLDPGVTEDGLHFNEAGYRRWAALIIDWAERGDTR